MDFGDEWGGLGIIRMDDEQRRTWEGFCWKSGTLQIYLEKSPIVAAAAISSVGKLLLQASTMAAEI